jgi:chemotaxis family two-component system response regulator Rcp1
MTSATAAIDTEALDILLVEDNEADIELTRLAFAEQQFDCNLAVTRNGAEAMDYLRKRDAYHDAATPRLILLDLNMPRMTGKQFLEAIKFDEYLRKIPVMLLTSSQAQHDINDCYHLHANCYLTKPSSAEERSLMVKRVSDFLSKKRVVAYLERNPGAS